MKRNYIGIANSFHDSALAIVSEDGEVLFAEATERYLQYKRSICIAPDLYFRISQLVDMYCDPDADLVLATSWRDDSRDLMREGRDKATQAARQYRTVFGDPPPVIQRQLAGQKFFHQSQLAMMEHPGHLMEYSLAFSDQRAGRKLERRNFEHHLTHAAASCFSSPFEDAVCAVLDGMGEEGAIAAFRYTEGELKPIDSAVGHSKASLGTFYTTICEACGFDPMSGEEWKVMGLAPYGCHDAELYGIIRELISVDGLTLKGPSPEKVSKIFQHLYDIRRRSDQPVIDMANLAYVGQQVFTETLLQYLSNLHATGLSDNLVLAGGCALNSSANGKVLENTPFKQLHVFSAPGDDGNAVGAALLAHRQDHPSTRAPARFMSPYLGSSMSPQTLDNVEKFGGLKVTRCADNAPQLAAQRLADGQIVGWIQGRAEFGPRALGNRSILADPRSASIKDVINTRVKFREEFRPFAPSVLAEFGPQYFENYQETPYMERTLKFRQEATTKVPGVVHADGTGRLQTVTQDWNPRFHALINEFYRLTDIPLVLNTSFNVMGKPIAHSVEDALAVFFTSGLDTLFIDNFMIEK